MEANLTNIRNKWMRAALAVLLEAHVTADRTFEELEGILANIPTAERQILDIKRANFHPPHHPCSLHSYIWSALPQDLAELVLSKLPMKDIIALTRSTPTSPCFRRRCAQRHPHLLALMRWDSASAAGASIRATVYDSSCNDWTGFDLTGFPTRNHRGRIETDHGYEDSTYAHEKGLLCFVPPSAAPVLVSNPLTGEWRTLPLLPHEHKPTLVVQLLVDEEGDYKVKMVCGDTDLKKLTSSRTYTPENSAWCYDSRTARWTGLETGFVFGASGTLQQFQRKVPMVFDCEKRVLFYLAHTASVQQPYNWGGARDSVAVFRNACDVTELAWRENGYFMRRTTTLGPYMYRFNASHLLFLFATERFLLVVGDSNVKVEGKSCQLLQLFDRETRNSRLVSDLGEGREASHPECLKTSFVCELRWDAVP